MNSVLVGYPKPVFADILMRTRLCTKRCTKVLPSTISLNFHVTFFNENINKEKKNLQMTDL